MALVVGENTYVTAAESDTYFSDKYGKESWATLDADIKEKALVSATQQLDLMCEWYGTPVDDEQDLAFPRTPDADPVPQEIKDSQCEIAYNINETGSTNQDGGDPLSRLKAGSVELQFEPSGSTSNPIVNDTTKRMLRYYGLCEFGDSTTKLVPMWRQ